MSLTIKKISSSDVCDRLTMESAAYGKYFAMIEWIVTDDSDESYHIEYCTIYFILMKKVISRIYDR